VRTTAAFLLVGLLLGLDATPSHAAAGDDPAWNQALVLYTRDPLRGRRELFRLERRGTADLPPAILMALADAHLRSGHEHAGERLFTQVLADRPGPPWETWAHLGLAWAALGRGDEASARDHCAMAARGGDATAALAEFIGGLLDMLAGRFASGQAVFDRLAGDTRIAPLLRTGARLGGGYARYWEGDFDGAAAIFDAVAASDPTGPLADDARYAAAWARRRGGHDEVALPALRVLAEQATSRRWLPAALIDLEPSAVLRASFQRYRRLPPRPPEDGIALLLDGDGAALARAALAHLSAAEDGNAPSRAADPASSTPAAPAVNPGRAVSRGFPEASKPVPPSATSGGRRIAMIGAAALLALLVGWSLRRGRSSSRRG
jgi:tetratricopeptide (TPR) repeat protein